MYKFPIFNYKRYSELPFRDLDTQKFAVYLLDLNWNFLFMNLVGSQNIQKKAADIIGNNVWEIFKDLGSDPQLTALKKNTEEGIASTITVVSRVTGRRVNITAYALEDCYYFSVSILPDKQNLLNELRKELGK